MNYLITYKEAVERIILKINESNKSLYKISEESGVSYNVLSLIRNKYKKQFPQSVEKLLKYFDIKAKKVIAFEIE